MSSKALDVSVIVSNYNYGAYVCDAVDSALAQTFAPREVIVVDDGSTDDSAERLRARYAANPLVRLLFKPNGGQLSAFIAGIEAAQGAIVAMLDADDLWEPGFLEAVIARYQQSPQVDFVYTNLRYFGAREGQVITDQSGGDKGLSVLLGAYRTTWQGAPTSALTLRRPLAQRLMKLPEEVISAWRTRADDCLVCGADILGGHKYFLDEPLVRYRAHDGNAWLGQIPDPMQRARHWLRVETMLEHYRRLAGVSPALLKHTKHEFRTKPKPSWGEFKVYRELLARAPLPYFKRLEMAFAMFAYWWRQR